MKNVSIITFRWCLTYDAVYIYNSQGECNTEIKINNKQHSERNNILKQKYRIGAASTKSLVCVCGGGGGG